MSVSASTPLTGIMLMLGFCIFGPTIDVFAKLAGQADVPVFQISAARFAVQALCLLPFALYLNVLRWPDRREAGLHLIRGLLILIATSFFFAAINHMPIADAISIFFIEPFILTLLGALFLGETVGWRRILACIIGFGGALLVIQPQYETVGLAAAFPAGTAVCFAFYLLLTRKMTQDAHPVTIQIFTSCAAFILVMPVLLVMQDGPVQVLRLVEVDSYQVSLLIGVGVCATIAHMFLTSAFRYTAVAILAPLQYLEIVSATVFGFFVFGDFPNKITFLGITIIIGSGLYVLMRERQLEKARQTDQTISQ